MKRVLAIDPGSRRVGVALSDEEGEIAFPLTMLDRAKGASPVDEIAALVKAHEVSEIIVGLPLRLDGTEGPEARRARAFADAVGSATGLTVTLWDERMTTSLAARSLQESGGGAKRRAHVDEAAATLLLQSYLAARRARS